MIKKIICIGVIILMLISMTACAPKQLGNFFSLQEAFDEGLLLHHDLKNIAYYQNGEIEDENFEPIPKMPEILSEKTKSAIKETRAYDLKNQSTNPIKDAKTKDITIVNYYGTYNNCVAVMIDDCYNEHDTALRDIEISGIVFHYKNGNRIVIWKEKQHAKY